MRTAPERERDGADVGPDARSMSAASTARSNPFDRWISWALSVETRNVQPSEQVWRRIVHRVTRLPE
jgi:hypothetical protein